MIDELAALRRARAEFERRLDSVTDHQYSLPTPCEAWDVITLIRHVVDGDTFATLIIEGATLHDALTALMGMDNSREFAHEADVLDAAFAAAAPDLTVDHPVGKTSVSDFLDFRATDYAAHAWDLARATGQDERLDPDLVERLWTTSVGRPDAALSREPPPNDADLQHRWLDRTGRHPGA